MNNKKRILNLLREKGALTKAQICNELEIGWATVCKFIEKLTEEKLLTPIGYSKYERGRIAKTFGLNSRFKIIGIDFELTRVSGIITSLDLTPIYEIKEEYKIGYNITENTKKLTKIIRNLIQQSPDGEIYGIGIGLPALIIKNNVPLKSDSYFELKSLYEKYPNIPIIVSQNIKNMAFLEKLLGKGKEYKDFIFLSIRSGVGMCIFINGKLYTGKDNLAGEVGHIILDPKGKLCRCGKKGCFETFVGVSYIKEDLKDFIDKEDNLLFSLSQNSKNKKLRNYFYNLSEKIALVLSYLTNIFNPEAIIIGGDIGIFRNFIEEKIIENFQKYVLPSHQKTKITFSKFMQEGALASAALIWENMLKGE